MRTPKSILLVPLAIAVFAAGAWAAGRQTPAAVTRNALAQDVNPPGARGQTLGLAHVTVPAHASLALHTHPGTQVAYIESGTLTYSVRTKSVRVYRGPGDAKPVLVRTIRAGQTAKLTKGDWIVENRGMQHQAANNGTRAVEIAIATLLKNGSPSAIPVN